MDDRIPNNGTKAAVAYWARRTRMALRDAERTLAEGSDDAEGFAAEAAGCAGEFEQAVAAALGRGWQLEPET